MISTYHRLKNGNVKMPESNPWDLSMVPDRKRIFVGVIKLRSLRWKN